MSDNIWERFEGIANTTEVESAKVSFTPIAEGDYISTLERIEAGVHPTTGVPVMNVRFRTDSNRVVFLNSQLQDINDPTKTPQRIAIAVSILDKLSGETVAFSSMSALVTRIENIKTGVLYNIRISYKDKDIDRKYPVVKILEKKDFVETDTSLPFDMD